MLFDLAPIYHDIMTIFRLALLTPTVTSRHMRSHNKLFNSNGSHAIEL